MKRLMLLMGCHTHLCCCCSLAKAPAQYDDTMMKPSIAMLPVLTDAASSVSAGMKIGPCLSLSSLFVDVNAPLYDNNVAEHSEYIYVDTRVII